VTEAERPPRPLTQLVAVLVLGALMLAGFMWLGLWQIERRAWKHDLIDRVEARLSAPVQPLARITGPPEHREYSRVRVTGRFDHDAEVLVQAVTELGGGFWVLTPLHLPEGGSVLVNRGFVPPQRRDPAARAAAQPEGAVSVTGLLRLTEPEGAFLRQNDPAGGRWYSRDVAAIAQRLGLTDAARDFIDADADPDVIAAGGPQGGLTVVQFRDTHLIYALTWFALAGLVAFALTVLIRHEYRLRR